MAARATTAAPARARRVVAEFVQRHAADPRFRDECELLRPILDGAGILYVVDGSRPYGREYEPEMEVLRWTGRPRLALINLIASGDHVDEWRAALSQFFSIVRVFDAMRADFARRIDLLRAFGAIDEGWTAQLNQAADALAQRSRTPQVTRGRRNRRPADRRSDRARVRRAARRERRRPRRSGRARAPARDR